MDRRARDIPLNMTCNITFTALISTLVLLGTAVRWLWAGANCGDDDALKVRFRPLESVLLRVRVAIDTYHIPVPAVSA